MDFSKVPHEDVVAFLNLRGVDISDDPNENYEKGASLVTEVGPSDQVPIAIADFMIAYSLHDRINEIDVYKMSDIYTNKINPNQQLQLNFADKDRITRILAYLGKLENDLNIYEIIPVPVLVNIMSNLSLPDIIGLCSSSQYLNHKCMDMDFWAALIKTKDRSFSLSSDDRKRDISHLKRRYGFLTSAKNGWPLGSGNNDESQLGNIPISAEIQGAYTGSLVPTRIPGVGKCVHMSTSRGNSVFILDDGRAVLKGDNMYGQLGHDDNGINSTIINSPKGEYFVMGSVSANRIVLLLSSGRVMMYGESQTDALRSVDNPYLKIDGFVVKIFSYIPNFHVFITNDDTMILYKPSGFDRSPVTQVLMSTPDMLTITSMIIKDIKKVAYNPNSTLYILLNSGRILYLSNDTPHWKYVDIDGIVDISMGFEYFILLRNDGTVYYRKTEAVEYDRFEQIGGLTTVVDIASGDNHAMFLLGDGSIYGMKSAEVHISSGIFGLKVGTVNTIDSTSTPKQYNIPDDPYDPSTPQAIFPPIKVVDKSHIVQIEAGSDTTLYLTSDPPGSGGNIIIPFGAGYTTININ